MELSAALRLNVRSDENVPDTPKPVAAVAPLAVIVTELSMSPSAASDAIERRPPEIVTVLPAPPKVLSPLSTRMPAPALLRVKLSRPSPMVPPIVSEFEPSTVTVEFAFRATAPLPKS